MKKFLYLLCLTLLANSITVNAQNPADLDSTFGIGGKVTTDILGYIDVAYAMALQDDGKIILTGYSLESSQTYREIALVRYLSDGSIDDSFGTNGIVISDVSDRMGEAYSIAIQPEGKIVVAGYSESSSTAEDNFTTIRYEVTGSPDTTFGTNGIVITKVGSGNNQGESIAIQNDGKIIVAGWLNHTPTDDIALVRYNTDGSLDNSFGGISGNGIIITDINSNQDYGKDVTLQSDGKIIVVGHSDLGGQGAIIVVRYDSIGILDASFGNGGIVTTTIGSNYARGQAVTIQQDGKLLIAGHSNPTGTYHFTLVRYNDDGSLDNSFGTNGIVVTTIGSSSDANSIALDYKGAILVGGTSDGNFTLARYDSSGNLDGSFGSGGIVITNFTGSSIDRGYSLAIQSDNKIVLAGEYENGFSDFAMARFWGDYSELTLLNPNGGEEWEVGTTQSITWNYFNSSELKIEYSIDDGSSWILIKDSLSVLTKTYDWVIPNTQSEQCLIKISDLNNPNIFDVSDTLFSILTLSTISVIEPNGGEIWAIGGTESIRWSSENVPDVKIQLSINNGASWTNIVDSIVSTGIYNWQIPTQLPSSQCRIKIISLADSNIYDISDSSFIIDLAIDVDEDKNLIPKEFQLLQNYPNPFNPATKIKYQIPEISFVTLKVFDVLGNEIATLVNEEIPVGSYEVDFNSKNLSGGVYFYRIQAGDFVGTKKMVLLK